MNVLFIGTEAVPFAKSGGLGDVLGALPKALRKEGVNTAVMIPLYKSIKEKYFDEMEKVAEFESLLAWRHKYVGVYKMIYDEVDFYFIDNEEYFKRAGYYGYYDDGERFAYFCKAVIGAISVIDFEPDILHVSEWQAALVPVYLKTCYSDVLEYKKLKTVFTIHNIEYQGKFSPDILSDVFGIDERFRNIMEYDGCINLLKAAIVSCDILTTVSPSYAEEIQYEFYAKGLQHIIKENSYKLHGILNGIDQTLYNPKKDKEIFARYDLKTFEKKKKNKNGMQNTLGLEERDDVTVIAMITRLVYHKGIELVMSMFDEIMEENVQFVLLASGDKQYEEFFLGKEEKYKGRVVCLRGFSEESAKSIYAGADVFLMPSVSEPCGLAQMIASKYGTVAIVRETGGLKDSISDYNPETGEGNGITFKQINAHEMLWAVKRAIETVKDEEHGFKLITNAFKSDFSWKKGAKVYKKIYKGLET